MRKLKNEELNRLKPAEFSNSTKLNVVLVLDDIRSMNNVGSVFRTADAFRIEKIFLCGITATPPHRDINKTALGATESVDWQYAKDISELIDELIKKNYQVLAIEQADKSISLIDFKPDPDQKYALIFGNEVFGVNESLLSRVAGVLEIPQFGTKHSLNISVSAGIVIWDFFQKMQREL